jgi:hypothetical protein
MCSSNSSAAAINAAGRWQMEGAPEIGAFFVDRNRKVL